MARFLNPPERWGQFRPGARQAAVVLVLHPRDGEWQVPFVLRRPDLPDHPGQVALPGGVVRSHESAWDAACREAGEEIGTVPGALDVLGAGDPVYTAVSNFAVATFVAHHPTTFTPIHDTGELTGILDVPLRTLLNADAWNDGPVPWPGRHLVHDGSTIWGLTARILSDLLPRIDAGMRQRPSAS